MRDTTIEALKTQLDIIAVAEQYCELKKVNANTYKAVVNPIREEKSSSLHFYSNTQKFFDFGSSESGDVFDLISKMENISLSELLSRYKDDALALTPQPIKEKPQPVQVIEISSEQLQEEFDKFESIDLSNPKHYEELLNVVPEYLLKEANEADIKLFMSCTRYDNQNQTLVAGWYKNALFDFEMITYKRRRLHGGKWINRKGTHPNSTVFNRIFDDTKPVYIVEGARDALTSILLGLNFIAIPTTSFKNIEAIQSLIKPDDEVIFICEDLAGYRAMKYLASAIPNSRLVTFVKSKDEKIDLSDYVNSCKTIEGVHNAISA